MIFKLNEKNKVAVVTPYGLTDRLEMEQIVLQGENFAKSVPQKMAEQNGRNNEWPE